MQTSNWRERLKEIMLIGIGEHHSQDCCAYWQGEKMVELEAFIEQVQKESIERAIEVLESKRRKYLHTVVAIGSQEHLNDTFREGYNQCIEDSSEALKTLLH